MLSRQMRRLSRRLAAANTPSLSVRMENLRWHSSTSKIDTTTIPSLKDFMQQQSSTSNPVNAAEHIPNPIPPYLKRGKDNIPTIRYPRKVFIETYGCQMNFGDSEIVLSVLNNSREFNKEEGDYLRTMDIDEAEVILLMTCAVRDNAEGKIFSRLDQLAPMKKQGKLRTVGVLGCMAERLKEKLFDLRGHVVDVICGPDAYRDLPRLLDGASLSGQRGVNVMLSMDETYADIAPVRLDESKHSAFVSIMRGCNNMCAFCIVPFTRGRERSRPIQSIVDEVKRLRDQGVKEITLLGQNVNSYHDESGNRPATTEVETSLGHDHSHHHDHDHGCGVNVSHHKRNPDSSTPKVVSAADLANRPRRRSNLTAEEAEEAPMSKNFKTVYKVPKITANSKRFVQLLEALADVDPNVRIRFTSPHPKDFPDGLLQLMRDRENICKQIHLPAQSGSTTMLERMRRGYSREAYLDLVGHIREIVPNVALSSDFIVGFCDETEEEHKQTLDLVEKVGYQMAYMFAYSMRPGTMAHRRYEDNVPAEVKQRRLQELIDLFYKQQLEQTVKELINTGREEIVLVEGRSKKSEAFLQGKIDNGRTVVFPRNVLPYQDAYGNRDPSQARAPEIGDWVAVKLIDKRGTTPIGEPQRILSGLRL